MLSLWLVVSDLILRYGCLCGVRYGSCVWGSPSLGLWICCLYLATSGIIAVPSSLFPGVGGCMIQIIWRLEAIPELTEALPAFPVVAIAVP